MGDASDRTGACLAAIGIGTFMVLCAATTDTYAFHNDFTLSWTSGIHAGASTLLFLIPSTKTSLLVNASLQLIIAFVILFDSNNIAIAALSLLVISTPVILFQK